MRSASEISKHFLWHFILHDRWTVPNLQDSIEYLVTEAVEAMQERLRLPVNNYYRTNPRDSSLDKVAVEVWDAEFMTNVIFQQVLGIDGAEVGLDKLLYKCDKFGIERIPRWRTRAECALAGLEPYQMYFEEFNYRFPYAEVLEKIAAEDYPDFMFASVLAYVRAEEEFDAYIRQRIALDYNNSMQIKYPTSVLSFEAYAVCMNGAMQHHCRIPKEIAKSYHEMLESYRFDVDNNCYLTELNPLLSYRFVTPVEDIFGRINRAAETPQVFEKANEKRGKEEKQE
jgi:hypothetical protein